MVYEARVAKPKFATWATAAQCRSFTSAKLRSLVWTYGGEQSSVCWHAVLTSNGANHSSKLRVVVVYVCQWLLNARISFSESRLTVQHDHENTTPADSQAFSVLTKVALPVQRLHVQVSEEAIWRTDLRSKTAFLPLSKGHGGQCDAQRWLAYIKVRSRLGCSKIKDFPGRTRA